MVWTQPDGIDENERFTYKVLWDVTIQCDHITEARRPVIVVVEKESNKAIIVDHRVYEKESEKVQKYQDLKREIRKFMGY